MILPGFDKYSVNARLIPALIVLLPIGLSAASLFPQKFLGWDLIVWLGASSGIGIFLEQLVRDKGKAKEFYLFDRWEGDPVVLMLSHHKSTMNPATLGRYHQKLSNLGIKIPPAHSEPASYKELHDIYEPAKSLLKSKTRDEEKFAMIFTESVNYGFRRNLWGMKPYALIFTIFSTCLVIAQIYPQWRDLSDARPVVWVALMLDILFLLIWIFYIRPEWIRMTRNEYAKQLLYACDQL